MSFRLVDILSLIAVFQLLLIAVSLFSHPRGRRQSNRLLGAFFTAVALNLADALSLFLGIHQRYPALAFWGSNAGLLFGPLLYFYTRSVVYRDFYFRWRVFLPHAAPFLGLLVLSVIFYHSAPAGLQRFILAQARQPARTPWAVYVVSLLGYGQLWAYLWLARREILRYRAVIENRFSDVAKINLSWLATLLGTFGIAMALAIIHSFLPLTPFEGYYELTLALIITALFTFVNLVFFRALQQPEIFAGIEKDSSVGSAGQPPAAGTTRKYLSSSLSETDRQAHLQCLLDLMARDELFLNPDLNINELALRMRLPVKIVSQVINESLGLSFFDFVNGRRVEKAKRLLHYPPDPKMTVVEIMYQSGFNSKSSFNTAFRKFTGTTPTEFKKQPRAVSGLL